MTLNCKPLRRDAVLPKRAKSGDAGLDLFMPDDGLPVFVEPGEVCRVALGYAVEIPLGYEGRIAPRSGYAMRYGVQVLGGVIDSGYRDELIVLLTSLVPYTIPAGKAVAQMVVSPVWIGSASWSGTLTDSERGTAGFGSTDRGAR